MQHRSPTQLLDSLRAHWADDPNAGLNDGISQDSLRDFESQNKVSVPKDFAQYLMTFNGFRPSIHPEGWDDVDLEGFRFYCLEELSEVGIARGYFEFCTWELGFLTYAISFRCDGTNGSVVKVGKNNLHTVSESFASFIELYLRDDPSLYKWGALVIAHSDA